MNTLQGEVNKKKLTLVRNLVQLDTCNHWLDVFFVAGRLFFVCFFIVSRSFSISIDILLLLNSANILFSHKHYYRTAKYWRIVHLSCRVFRLFTGIESKWSTTTTTKNKSHQVHQAHIFHVLLLNHCISILR